MISLMIFIQRRQQSVLLFSISRLSLYINISIRHHKYSNIGLIWINCPLPPSCGGINLALSHWRVSLSYSWLRLLWQRHCVQAHWSGEKYRSLRWISIFQIEKWRAEYKQNFPRAALVTGLRYCKSHPPVSDHWVLHVWSSRVLRHKLGQVKYLLIKNHP